MTFITNGPGEMSLGTADRAAAIAEVKRSLRVATGDDDALIAAFAETALGLAEKFLGRVIVVRSIVERLAASRYWQALGACPVMSITSVSAVVGDSVTALSVGDYAIDLDARAAGWIRVMASAAVVEVAYQAGWVGGWAAIPAPVRQGVVLLAAHLYDQRDASEPPPAAVTALWRPFRAQMLTPAMRL